MYEFYLQLLPTKLYNTSKKTKTTSPADVMCRLCGKCPESIPHILAGCSAFAQSKYLERHNSALKELSRNSAKLRNYTIPVKLRET